MFIMKTIDQRNTTIVPYGNVSVDLGCGACEILDPLANFYDVTVDLDINFKRAQAPRAWSFVYADLNLRFPLKTINADTVFANQVIEHIIYRSRSQRVCKS